MIAETRASRVAVAAMNLSSVFLKPWVAVLIWRWHVAPFGVPALGYWQAFGVLIFVRMATYRYAHEADKQEWEYRYRSAVDAFAMTLAALTTAWLTSFGVAR